MTLDDHTADRSGANVVQQPLQLGAIKGFARLAFVVVPFAVPDPAVAKVGHYERQACRKLGFTGGEVTRRRA